MNRYTLNDKMRDIIKENRSLILVMGRFGISLGVDNQTVRDVCILHNVDERTFIEVINFVSGKEYNYNNIYLPSLIGYLKEAHEYFLNFNLPNIRRKLIEAIDCSKKSTISMLIIRFFDEFAAEVKKHMEYENDNIFTYVEQLNRGLLSREFDISNFAGQHTSIGFKLEELKDIIVRYYPEKNNYLLNSVLLDIISCDADLTSHCMIEDKIFIPAVKIIEQQLKNSDTITYSNGHENSEIKEREKVDPLSEREKVILLNIAKGLSNKEIANALNLSIHTVTTHRRNISNKLQIHTTAGLIIYAIANELININDIK